MTRIIKIVFFILSLSLNSQSLGVIDHKGTRKMINNVTEGVVPSSPVKGDIYFDNFNNTRDIKIFDGVQWRTLSLSNVHVGHFIIKFADNGTSKKITGLPFKPSLVNFVAYVNIDKEDINSSNNYTFSFPEFDNDNVNSVENSFGNMNGFAISEGNTIKQQSVCNGGSATSINDISRYSSSKNCIGLRYSSQNGYFLGSIEASLSSFFDSGFELDVSYTDGTYTYDFWGILNKNRVLPSDIRDREVLVMYTAYK